jgi:hypothetical protein
LTESVSEAIAELYAFGAGGLYQSFMDTATGLFLTRKAREFGKERKAAIKTTGAVLYSRKVARSTNITIPINSIVATKKDRLGRSYRFFTTEERILESVRPQFPCRSIAEDFGKAYNVEAGSIVEMRTYIGGIDEVTNESDWIDVAGADEESDAALRRRGFMAWEELAANGRWVFINRWRWPWPAWHRRGSTTLCPRGEGTVDVYIMGESGPPLSGSALIAAVQAAIEARRAPGSDVKVFSAGDRNGRPDAYGKLRWPGTTQARSRTKSTAACASCSRWKPIRTASEIPVLGVGPRRGRGSFDLRYYGRAWCIFRRRQRFTVEREGSSAQDIRPAADIVIDPDEFPALGDSSITFTAASYERQT